MKVDDVSFGDIKKSVETFLKTSFVTTNDLACLVEIMIEELIGYAKADVEASLENGTKHQAALDKQRVRNLKKIYDLLQGCYR